MGFFTFAEKDSSKKTLGIYFRPVRDVSILTDAHQAQIFADLDAALARRRGESGGTAPAASGSAQLFDLEQCGNSLSVLKERAMQAWAESTSLERGTGLRNCFPIYFLS